MGYLFQLLFRRFGALLERSYGLEVDTEPLPADSRYYIRISFRFVLCNDPNYLIIGGKIKFPFRTLMALGSNFKAKEEFL